MFVALPHMSRKRTPPQDQAEPSRLRTEGGRWSWAEDRRLIQLAGSLKSLESVASLLGRKPEAVARSAKRLGVSLKPESSS